MKKQRFSSIITCIGCLLILLIVACGDDADDDDYNNDYDDPDHPIIYPVFERTLAEALGKTPGEEITPDELATLTHLTFPPPRALGPFFGRQSIKLLAHCINLKELDLYGYVIADFSPLAGLTRLERLNLRNTLISDLEPLAGLVNLQKLDLSMNRLNDLTVLAGMIQLKELDLHDNQIRDITPLANLIQIEKLYLQHNMIVDLKPLVDNLGLVNKNPVHLEGGFDWQADVVGIHDNPLSEVSRNVYIPALEARGVIVRQ
jgi:Leucine-rich repeat (LRR) protein